MRLRRGDYLIATGVAIFHTFIAVFHGGPVAVPDVSAYLSVAQWPSGGVLPADLAFHPGYGLLLTPFGGLNGATLHTAALIFNGVIAGLCALLASCLAQRFGASPRLAYAAAGITAIHPSLSTSSRIAWPETLLIAVLLALTLLVHVDKWMWAGVAAGAVVVGHPRAVVLLAAVILAALAKHRFVSLALGLLPTSALTVVLLQITDTWPHARISAAQTIGPGPGPLATLSGQWLALGAGTAGLATVGLIVALKGFRSRHEPASHIFLGLSASGMLALGAWVLAGSDRVDTILYGRYIGLWAIPLSILGLVAISRGEVTRQIAYAASGVTLMALLIALAAAGDLSDSPRRIMTLSLSAVWVTFDNRFVVTVITAALLVAVTVTASRRGLLIPITVFAFLAVPSTILNHRHLHDVGNIADAQITTANLVPDDANCLAHDTSTKSYALWLYRLELPKMQHRRINLAAGDKPCGNYVIAAADALSECVEAKLLATERRAKWGLWHYPPQGCG